MLSTTCDGPTERLISARASTKGSGSPFKKSFQPELYPRRDRASLLSLFTFQLREEQFRGALTVNHTGHKSEEPWCLADFFDDKCRLA